MAVYTPDLSAMTTGVQVAGFTKRYEANFSWPIADQAGAPYGKVIRCPTESANARNGLTLDAIDSDPDRAYGETFIQFKASADLANGDVYIMARGDGAAATETLSRYGVDVSNGDLTLVSYSGGSFSPGGSVASGVTITSGTVYNMLVKIYPDGASDYEDVTFWQKGTAQPAPQILKSGPLGIDTAANWRGLFRFVTGAFDIEFVSFSTGTTDVADREPSASIPTLRKSSTFDIETTLGTITTATLNSVNVFDHVTGQTGTTVSFAGAATDEITTSGEYTLTLGDGVGTENITVQVNVVGLPSNTLRKAGSLQINLTDIELNAFNASDTLVEQLTGLTSDGSGVMSPVDLSSLSEAVGDNLTISLYSASATTGITFIQALELI